MTESMALGVFGLSVAPGTHLCIFFRGSSGMEEIVLPFLAEGIRANDKCLAILESRMPSDLLAGLALQIDVGPSVATGQLELVTPAETYLRSGQFSTQEMLDYWARRGRRHAERRELQPHQGHRRNAVCPGPARGPGGILPL